MGPPKVAAAEAMSVLKPSPPGVVQLYWSTCKYCSEESRYHEPNAVGDGDEAHDSKFIDGENPDKI